MGGGHGRGGLLWLWHQTLNQVAPGGISQELESWA